jgi:hypothetical protein
VDRSVESAIRVLPFSANMLGRLSDEMLAPSSAKHAPSAVPRSNGAYGRFESHSSMGGNVYNSPLTSYNTELVDGQGDALTWRLADRIRQGEARSRTGRSLGRPKDRGELFRQTNAWGAR